MAMQDQDFWRRMGRAAPGLFDLGAGVYGMNEAQDEAAANLQAARDPYYQAASAGASTALKRADGINPKKAGAEWLRTQRGLLRPGDAADEAALMRQLQATGMLGAASYGVQGPGAAEGVAQNPLAAAFYAQRANRDAKLAAEAFDRGEAQIDRMVNRSGMLSGQAANRQNANLNALRTQPSRAASRLNLLKGAGSILKDTGVLKDIGGLFGNLDWLDTGPDAWGTDFSMGFY